MTCLEFNNVFDLTLRLRLSTDTLLLSNNHLQGNLPAELGGLTQLGKEYTCCCDSMPWPI